MSETESEYEGPVTRSQGRKRRRLDFCDTDSSGDDDRESDPHTPSSPNDEEPNASVTASEDEGEGAEDEGAEHEGDEDEGDERDGDTDDVAEDDAPALGEPQILTQNTTNRCYLVTYSQINKAVFPTRQDFAEMCVNAFGGVGRVVQFACAEEVHRTNGSHYHMAIKLEPPSRWLTAKNYLAANGAVVNFARPPVGGVLYAWIYRYITKYDTEVFHLEEHPTLERIEGSRCMERALLAAIKGKGGGGGAEGEGEGEGTGNGKSVRLKDSDVAQYCRRKSITTLTELMADAEVRMSEGDNTFHNYIFSRTLKQMAELLVKTEWMQQAPGTVERKKIPRVATVKSALQKECVNNCDGVWYDCAVDILRRSSINKYVFAYSIRQLLENGRGRKRNIYLLGPTASGKTFLLKPLLDIFPGHFANPPASSFGWLGADEARIIVLNDYRWENKRNGGNIEWGALLNLLEGFATKLPAPMNSYAKHILVNTDVPIFATGPEKIRWYSNNNEEARGKRHAKEDSQMDDRWVTYELKHTFPKHERIYAESCVSCFAKLCYLGYDD